MSHKRSSEMANTSVQNALALSTAWNSDRHRSGKAMLKEIVSLGFTRVEVHEKIRPIFLPEIDVMVEKGEIGVVSVRNFCCSAASGRPQFSSHDEKERKEAIRLTQETIDYAVRWQARYVILDCGRDGRLHSFQRLRKLALQGKLYTKTFAQVKIQEIQKREKESVFLQNRVSECLRQIGDYSGERGIRIGIENQKAYEDFPTERELPALLDVHPVLGYWHNFGNGQIKHHLTLLDHREWLKTAGKKAIGCTLDDIKGFDRQHFPPFTGIIPYNNLMPLLPKDCVFTLNLKEFDDTGTILNAVERWKTTFLNEKNPYHPIPGAGYSTSLGMDLP